MLSIPYYPCTEAEVLLIIESSMLGIVVVPASKKNLKGFDLDTNLDLKLKHFILFLIIFFFSFN